MGKHAGNVKDLDIEMTSTAHPGLAASCQHSSI
jgi:hypothetical protein